MKTRDCELWKFPGLFVSALVPIVLGPSITPSEIVTTQRTLKEEEEAEQRLN